MRLMSASKISFMFVLIYLLSMASAAESQLAPIRIAYATTSGIRAPLWIAEEARLFEKYGLDAKLINIPSGNTAISALVSGEVDVVSGSGSASIIAAGRGLPVVIVGSFGSTTYKLVANPGVTDLRGKTVGTSRIGSTTDFALRRALSKLGLTPDKDVKILATGIGEADKRIMLMLQGRMEGTLGSPESILAAETQAKVKLEILADLEEMKRRLASNERRFSAAQVHAHLEALAEAAERGLNREELLLFFKKLQDETPPDESLSA